ncbi:Carbonyl reductase [NADPH] 3 [Orchesella cincta]|uniref:Carbonyl reductase [NADPH] 3 n=1 Tax=Orchesella cincta TaxID=48709 RepID=A0A1D2N5R0_ORCCI|nr:Carbonyl reductase [NADPH] 3 [Orchesella cincta]
MGSEKIAVVTGSNKGIGLAIVRGLCKQFNGTVYLTARDEVRGMEAVKCLEQEGLTPKFHQLDTDSESSIKIFRDHILKNHGGIDVLVNNAAMAFKNSATEPFSYQANMTLRVNYFDTLNVCDQLFPLLRKHARVVHMSSYAGHLTRINGKEPEAATLRSKLSSPTLTTNELNDLVKSFLSLAAEGKHEEAGWPNTSYGVSKVAVSALGRIQQREFDEKRPNDDIVLNNVHPGLVDTDMTATLVQ